MADFVLIPRFPTRQQLAWFFRTRPTLSTAEAGVLLGWFDAQVHFQARDDGVLLEGERVAFADVAFWLLDAWPRAWLTERLGQDSVLLPHGLHVTRAPWALPWYVVRAMAAQAERQLSPEDVEHKLTVEDYVARVLHLAIEPETVAALAGDAAFLAAYHYPEDGADSGG